ncbi:hypothetical protein AA100600_3008 [Gluconobacter thailandicus F149-1 = NBRC 100600]|nr:hypothetical protein AA100600_3008 [Gluconobacter thailandicus F149-1 = NBRC 100600]
MGFCGGFRGYCRARGSGLVRRHFLMDRTGIRRIGKRDGRSKKDGQKSVGFPHVMLL